MKHFAGNWCIGFKFFDMLGDYSLIIPGRTRRTKMVLWSFLGIFSEIDICKTFQTK